MPSVLESISGVPLRQAKAQGQGGQDGQDQCKDERAGFSNGVHDCELEADVAHHSGREELCFMSEMNSRRRWSTQRRPDLDSSCQRSA